MRKLHGIRINYTMDFGILGGLIGIGTIVIIGFSVYIRDRCNSKKPMFIHPLIAKRQSFRVKNLFSHVDI
jgi:hypothetical protein